MYYIVIKYYNDSVAVYPCKDKQTATRHLIALLRGAKYKKEANHYHRMYRGSSDDVYIVECDHSEECILRIQQDYEKIASKAKS